MSRKKCFRDSHHSLFFFKSFLRSRGRFLQTCGGGTRTRESVLVSTIIRVSSRRMSFINAGRNSGRILVFIRKWERKRRRVRERERERGEQREGERTRKVEKKSEARGTRERERENDGGEVSIVLLRPRGLGASPSVSPRSLLLLLLFFIIIFAFPTFCFMLMVAPCCYPLHQPPPSLSLFLSLFLPLSPLQPPIPSRRPLLRMHGLGELLAFCLEFKKFFHLPLPPRPVALRPDSRLVAQPSLSSLRISSVSFHARLHAPCARFCLVNIRGEKYKEMWNGRKTTLFLPSLSCSVFLIWICGGKKFADESAIEQPDIWLYLFFFALFWYRSTKFSGGWERAENLRDRKLWIFPLHKEKL